MPESLSGILRAIPIFVLLSLLGSGCASIGTNSRYQVIYVQSNPPGARILHNDEDWGVTPETVMIKRKRRDELTLQMGGRTQKVPLETKYRWGDSFFGNFLFLTYAPIGWFLDWKNGTAWDFQDPAPVQFPAKSKPAEAPRQQVIAIAPPLAENMELSNEAAAAWQAELARLYPRAKILDYESSLDAFLRAGYEFDTSPEDPTPRKNLFYELEATDVFISRVQDTGKGLSSGGWRVDALGAVQGDEHPLARSVETPAPSQLSWIDKNEELIQLIPNTFGFDFSNMSTLLNHDSPTGEVSYGSEQVLDSSTLAQFLSTFESLTVSRLQPPRPNGAGRWKFQITPGGRLSYQRIFFPTFPDLAYVEFQTLRVGLGLGPEIGYQIRRHYLYFKVIPLLSYFQIQWEQPGEGRRRQSSTPIDFQTELGYLYFMTNNLNLRLYTKSLPSTDKIWDRVVHEVNPVAPEISSPREIHSGISFGYTFDSRSKTPKKKN